MNNSISKLMGLVKNGPKKKSDDLHSEKKSYKKTIEEELKVNIDDDSEPEEDNNEKYTDKNFKHDSIEVFLERAKENGVKYKSGFGLYKFVESGLKEVHTQKHMYNFIINAMLRIHGIRTTAFEYKKIHGKIKKYKLQASAEHRQSFLDFVTYLHTTLIQVRAKNKGIKIRDINGYITNLILGCHRKTGFKVRAKLNPVLSKSRNDLIKKVCKYAINVIAKIKRIYHINHSIMTVLNNNKSELYIEEIISYQKQKAIGSETNYFKILLAS